ncbi:Y-family DNA polymerase [Pedobacter steynii]|uniref:Nucleotidyltransferase n=1 Tax=Pedobacter steynii TaxID=430522 RepID=A0A1D7QNG3_9SPHI|nr:DNA polymerase Y family protein [Pedobacter steynii]AOM80195.1 nucleotidyltransferase [Pedobacter steynii]
MSRRYLTIWFRHLTTDQLAIRKPELKGEPFVLAAAERGRMVVKACSAAATKRGIETGMALADARAILPDLDVLDNHPLRAGKLLRALAEWSLRYTPVAAVDLPDGLILDVSGCTHLWGGEDLYLREILTKLRSAGYEVSAAIADTIGAAWAISRFGQISAVVEPGDHMDALRSLPPAALRLEAPVLERLQKLGLYQVRSFINMPARVLRRRFGQDLLTRLDQALGRTTERIEPIQAIVPYQERLPALEPIRTATGIEIALRKLLDQICQRLFREGKGMRKAVFKGYRIDGKIQQIEIGTNQPVRNIEHLFKLFALKIATIAPGLGIELFVLEAPVTEDLSIQQESLWAAGNQENSVIAGLLDRLAGRFGAGAIHRYLPDQHHWPERSICEAKSLEERPAINWPEDQPRPVCLLPRPEPIQVTSPIPDYPPMLFIYKGKVHKIRKADGPERIEREWWIEQGLIRDYYRVEDEQGARYWVFRSGQYKDDQPEWFIHGFFA